MGELVDGLADPATDRTERGDITIGIHVRLLRPVLSLTLLFMTLPLVLGGYDRNMFLNLGFALGNSAIFYGSIWFASIWAATKCCMPRWLPGCPCSSSPSWPPGGGTGSGHDERGKAPRQRRPRTVGKRPERPPSTGGPPCAGGNQMRGPVDFDLSLVFDGPRRDAS